MEYYNYKVDVGTYFAIVICRSFPKVSRKFRHFEKFRSMSFK